MKTISKKIIIYIFVGLLVFCSTSTIYYKSVHAMEWVGGALAFEEALKWTLAVLGITATAGMTDAYWDEYGDEFVDYAIENGATQAEVAEWQLKLCEGVLDKASSVWTSFKNWASSLVTSSGGSGGSVTTVDSLDAVLNVVNNEYGTSFTVGTGWDNVSLYGVSVSRFDDNFPVFKFYLSENDISFNIDNRNYSIFTFSNGFSSVWNLSGIQSNNASIDFNSSEVVSHNSPWNAGVNLPNRVSFLLFGITNEYIGSSYPVSVYPFDVSGGIIADDNFQVVPGVDVPSVDVISSDVPDEEDPEITLPFPGLDTSDDSISSDTYDDIIGAINDGTISIDDGIDDIISRLRVISYDEVTGDVIPPRPDPDDPTQNVKKDDVVNDNKNNMGFTLAGLEGVFPFCIPWDIYAFMTLLVADPVAPEFDFPIKSVNNQTEEIHVDLAPFEPVAVVVRYIFDFLFIIGLAMLTRSLIGGGSSD